MEEALRWAGKARAQGEVPVGAVLSDTRGRILAAAHNQVEGPGQCAAGHAEMLAMAEGARRLGQSRLVGCTLTVTLEPCAMCAAAIGHFRIQKLVFGAYDSKGGAVTHGPRLYARGGSLHRPGEIIGGVQERRCGALMRDFFQQVRSSPTSG
ncbi:nucleoside deaminase [Formicincola oecophyllae]|uniref:tRNA-specific adenosine deaminase n=1 Tax=Formicincola oecophyllae TaxID=2558361 RepID=A0A4Y6UAZ1_9PROT|nr:nucleoside deaminase [Formicincola oecophyllae]QDH14304.1 nucleoside deaminase [Formicincola oecophyllae]